MINIKLEERIKVNTEWQGDCLVWTGYISSYGYGRTKVDYKEVYLHRYAWERVHGPIPDTKVIDHKCNNRACMNELHLRLATNAQNTYNKAGANSNNKSSGVRNVSWNRDHWQVRITKNRVRHYFGPFATIEEASIVAEEKRKIIYGEFAGRALT